MTKGQRERIAWALIASGLSTACGGPAVGRIGPALPLPNGEAVSPCEKAHGWYELAPTRVQAQAATAGLGYSTVYFEKYDGYGLYRPGGTEPELLDDDAWQRLGEPELQRKHEARITPVDAATNRSLYWALGGLAGLATGVGIAAGVQEEHKTTAAVAGVAGVALGIVGVIGAIISQPSGYAQLEANARRTLFIPSEDDMSVVSRGTNRANANTRRACGGTPAPDAAPNPAPASAAVTPAPAAVTPAPAPEPSVAAPAPDTAPGASFPNP
jgi:hypothetical protein